MSRAYEDLTGRRFGRLVVVSREMRALPSGKRMGVWLCRCDCGTEKTITTDSLVRGTTRSCGCLHKDVVTKHGLYLDPLYKSWNNIRHRICNPLDRDYHRYGGRGLSIEPEWATDFASFRSWVLTHLGPKPSPQHSIDRIENDLGYMKGNLRWATPVVQQNNKRSNRLITWNGETLNLTQWCSRLGLNYNAVRMRIIVMKWPIDLAFTVPTDGVHTYKIKKYQSESSHATA